MWLWRRSLASFSASVTTSRDRSVKHANTRKGSHADPRAPLLRCAIRSRAVSRRPALADRSGNI